MIRVKRIYEEPAPDDGYRVLVDRLWPRGVAKAAAQLSAWQKDLAPSEDLRRWFAHDPARWEEFQRRYGEDLADPAKTGLVSDLLARSRQGTVTLVYAARDHEHNNAVVLKNYLEARLRAEPR
jgi:uncharacterized protein YeaO (DUF488 family)